MEYHSGGSLPLLGRPRYCPGANADGGYLCETGHCCGETGCCTYYYELWWFWMLWTVLIVFSCCCAYRHRRAKQRVQQQQRQREISLLAYHGASSYPSSMLDLSFLASLKLPSYEEVAAQPSTPPPPYSSVFTTPRYPQPPRAADPHLLTQHGPLLHHPLSDGPSSLSSDNSSSCSCDSCCPSSPCSSSLSAPITYETDTSHASTPSEAAAFSLDVAMETVGAVSVDMSGADGAGPQEPDAADSSVPGRTVARTASPGPEPDRSAPATPDREPRTPTGSACSCSTLPGPHVDPQTVPAPKSTWASGPPPPAPAAPEDRGSPGALDSALGPCSPTSEPPSQPARTLVLDSDPGPGSVPASPDLLQTPAEVLRSRSDEEEPRLLNVPADPLDSHVVPTQKPTARLPDCGGDPCVTPETAAASPALARCGGPAVQGASSPDPGSALVSGPDSEAPDRRGAAPPPRPDLTPLVVSQDQIRAGSGPDPPPHRGPVLAVLSAASCPVITVDSDSSLTPRAAPGVATPPPPPSLTPPPPPAPALLLDPLTALHQPERGGCSSGHASSLSPSPRATQSPPKQTVFSPCVDVFEPGPARWGDGEDGGDGEEDEDDVGADESQYRHRRLTGDSGIEVCRCRVEEEEQEEEEQQEEVKDEEEGRGEVEARGEKEEKGGVDPDLHDSVDCPARGPVTLCSGAAAPPRQDGGKVMVVMETV